MSGIQPPSRRDHIMHRSIPAIHPGQILWHDYLECSDQALNQLASQAGLPGDEVRRVVRGEQPITPFLARILEEFLQISASFWLAIQADFDRMARAG